MTEEEEVIAEKEVLQAIIKVEIDLEEDQLEILEMNVEMI